MKTGENKKALGEKGLKLGRVALMAALLSSSAFVPLSYANPEGGQVVGGAATISESGKKLDVHQHTGRAVIDWRSFNIDVDEHTEFHQPSSSATALNRVKSADPSAILGKLSANGNIVLVNPNGVFFGRDSVVDVNGLVATTADIDTDKFMAGGNHFNIPGNPDGVIVNEGTITAKDAGLVGLVAPNVENHGIIKAKMGRVQLASGDTVVADFYGDGLLEVEVTDDNVKSQFVGNTGALEAEGGTVAMTAAAARQTVNSLIVAKGELKAPTISKQGGKIIIGAAGSNKTDKDGASAVIVQASLDASGRNKAEQGGSIEVLGDHIAILDGTVMDASGHSATVPEPRPGNGTATMTADKQVRSEEDFMADARRAGGSIKIGGDYLGGGDTQTAKTLYVGANTLTLNNAIESGDAGRTIFWSDETTDFNGLVLARGGENSGNGGFLETSGKINLLANGFADLSVRYDPTKTVIPSEVEGSLSVDRGSDPSASPSAPVGMTYQKGTYLLDPADITIYGTVDPTFVSTDATVNLAANLQLWLDGNDIDGDGVSEDTAESGLVSGVPNCGAAITCVSQWTDKSGNGNNATQGSASNRPEFVSNGQNGLDVVGFDGANTYLQSLLPIDLMSGYSIFHISANDVSTNYNGIFRVANTGITSASLLEIYWQGGGNSGNIVTAANRSGAFRGYQANASLPLLGNYGINGTIAWDASTSQQFYNSTTRTVDGSFGGGSFLPAATGNYYVGIGYGGAGLAGGVLDGKIADLIAYNTALSDSDRQIIEQYQSAKWGIALTPPGTGADEASKAMASDGYGAFTTDYLERLSSSADIVLAADNSITLDLQGDTLALDNDRSLSLTTTNGSITDVSAGTIRTNRTGTGGNISITAGGAGDIALDTTNLEALGGGLVNLSAGGDVNLTQASALNLGTVSGQSISVQTTGGTSDVTLNNTITATDSGNALTIASGRNFINNAGAGALNTTDINGRWLVYSADPSVNTLGGLTSDFKRYNKTWAGYAPGSVVETGDGLLYSIAPTLNIAANNQSRNFGQSNPALTYSYSGLIDSDTLIQALGVLPTLTTSAGTNSIAGNYPIIGTFSSALGYTINFTPGTLSVNPLTSLPPSFEGVAYANNGLSLSQNLAQNYIFDYGSLSQSLMPSQITFTIAQAENNESEEGNQPSVRRTQNYQGEDNIQTTGMNVTIEAALARSLGLTQEKINAMFR